MSKGISFISLDRRPGEESDAESSRETSSDGSSDTGAERRINAFVHGTWSQQNIADANIENFSGLSLRNKPFVGSSSEESEICNPPGQLIFEYLEHDPPFSREPLADKASALFLRRTIYLVFSIFTLIMKKDSKPWIQPTDWNSRITISRTENIQELRFATFKLDICSMVCFFHVIFLGEVNFFRLSSYPQS